MPLRTIPTFTSIVRLDIPCCSIIEGPLCPAPWKKSGMAYLGLRPVSRKPGHDIGNLFRRHWPALHITAPVRCAQFRAACNDNRSEFLVTHQGQVGSVHDRARLIPPAPIPSLTVQPIVSQSLPPPWRTPP